MLTGSLRGFRYTRPGLESVSASCFLCSFDMLDAGQLGGGLFHSIVCLYPMVCLYPTVCVYTGSTLGLCLRMKDIIKRKKDFKKKRM